MLNINGYKYWTFFGATLREVIVLNRKRIEGGFEPYDEIAPAYDEAFSDEESLDENEAVMSIVGPVDGLSSADITAFQNVRTTATTGYLMSESSKRL